MARVGAVTPGEIEHNSFGVQTPFTFIMSQLALDLEGIESLEARFEELQEQGDSDIETIVESKADYGKYLEWGTRYMPPYPFFFPAIRSLTLDPDILLRRHVSETTQTVESTDELILNISSALEAQMKLNATAAASSARRSPGTHPEHPQVQTGTLRARIGFRIL